MRFNLYIGNHGKRDGIEDYIVILREIITRRGHELVVSECLYPKLINIIIDEFTNYLCNEEISAFKRHYPHAKLIFVLTEFIESRLLVRSFNFFGGLLDAAPIAAMNVYCRLRRDDFLPPSFRDWLVAIAYSPFLLVYYLLHCLKNWRSGKPVPLSSRLHPLSYMLERYLGLEKMIGCADGVILSHAMIEAGLRKLSNLVPVLGTLYPEIDFEELKKTLFTGKRLYIEVTGSITPYRQRCINKINSDIIALGIKNIFDLCQAISFGSANSVEGTNRSSAGQTAPLVRLTSDVREKGVLRGAYSLHPPQSRRWRYASPIRIFRALQHDHNMPVLTKQFNQHPIEHLCLVYRGQETLARMYWYYKDPKELFDFLEPRIREYMHVATDVNDAIVAAMVTIAGADDPVTKKERSTFKVSDSMISLDAHLEQHAGVAEKDAEVDESKA
jgi:hypothetical protein